MKKRTKNIIIFISIILIITFFMMPSRNKTVSIVGSVIFGFTILLLFMLTVIFPRRKKIDKDELEKYDYAMYLDDENPDETVPGIDKEEWKKHKRG